jgi:YHS domain-containing protein
MRIFNTFIGATLLAFASGAFAGELGDECAWGLANNKHVKTDCKVNMVGSDGKTYCFSSQESKEAFAKEPEKNLKKAKEVFGRA